MSDVNVAWTSRVANSARNALRPGYARVMGRKVVGRVRGDARQAADAVSWARPLSVPTAKFCASVDADLWDEAKDFGEGLRQHAQALGARLGVKIGGGARAELLYFVTRLLKPSTILETGVLYGYSSSAFLHALDRNANGGRLFSSDFPYFRERDPEQHVGVLVPEELRSAWTLLLEGDRKNLPALLERAGEVDLFHYDSDKTYAGRRHAMDLVEPHLGPDAAVLMDDIQDNLFFRDWVQARGVEPVVLGRGSFFVGATGLAHPGSP